MRGSHHSYRSAIHYALSLVKGGCNDYRPICLHPIPAPLHFYLIPESPSAYQTPNSTSNKVMSPAIGSLFSFTLQKKGVCTACDLFHIKEMRGTRVSRVFSGNTWHTLYTHLPSRLPALKGIKAEWCLLVFEFSFCYH